MFTLDSVESRLRIKFRGVGLNLDEVSKAYFCHDMILIGECLFKGVEERELIRGEKRGLIFIGEWEKGLFEVFG